MAVPRTVPPNAARLYGLICARSVYTVSRALTGPASVGVAITLPIWMSPFASSRRGQRLQLVQVELREANRKFCHRVLDISDLDGTVDPQCIQGRRERRLDRAPLEREIPLLDPQRFGQGGVRK